MDFDLNYNEDGSVSVDRLEFTSSILGSIADYLEGNTFRVADVNANSVTVKYEDGSTDTFNLTDQMDTELKLLVFVAVGAANFSAPKILFHLADVDNDDDLDVTGLSLADFSGIVVATDDSDFEYTLELGARYLRNLFKLKGVMSFSGATDEKPKDLALTKNESEDEDADALSELYTILRGKDEAVTTIAQLRHRALMRPKREKRLAMLRAKDPSAARARSLKARLNWRKNRMSIVKGIKKFHNSSQGKRLHKLMAQYRASKKKPASSSAD